MKHTAMLLGLLCLGLAPPANAEEPANDNAQKERARMLRQQFIDLEAIGRARVWQERGLKPPRRPLVSSVSNVEEFEPVTARFVRFNVQATIDGIEPCIQALEINEVGGKTNLTAASGVRLTASSIMPSFLLYFREGKYIAHWVWVSGEKGKGWLQVELPAAAKINRVVWSRDPGGKYRDRVASVYKIETSEDGKIWQTVATDEGRPLWGADYWVPRAALVKALDAEQRKQHSDLILELKKLGGPRLNEVKSGLQVGESVPGGFVSLFLNGIPMHAGKQRCPV
jgi:hypothetical protein